MRLKMNSDGLVGIVFNMLQHVVTTCHLSSISGWHGWHLNLVTEWVVGVTCHELLRVVYDTTRWCILLSVFVVCCDATKKDVDVTSHPSCWRHVTKCHTLLTFLPPILLRRHTTIPTKSGGNQDFLVEWKQTEVKMAAEGIKKLVR